MVSIIIYTYYNLYIKKETVLTNQFFPILIFCFFVFFVDILGVHNMTLQNIKNESNYVSRMKDINELLKLNEKKLDTLKNRFQGLKGDTTKKTTVAL